MDAYPSTGIWSINRQTGVATKTLTVHFSDISAFVPEISSGKEAPVALERKEMTPEEAAIHRRKQEREEDEPLAGVHASFREVACGNQGQDPCSHPSQKPSNTCRPAAPVERGAAGMV